MEKNLSWYTIVEHINEKVLNDLYSCEIYSKDNVLTFTGYIKNIFSDWMKNENHYINKSDVLEAMGDCDYRKRIIQNELFMLAQVKYITVNEQEKVLKTWHGLFCIYGKYIEFHCILENMLMGLDNGRKYSIKLQK